jgi:diguanylate cyclase (GGDEF)-like protein
MAQREIDRAQRYKQPFSLAYIDLDDFKFANDKFGHQIGDEILCAFVDLVNSQLRKTDILARMGGDEFILFLPETTPVAAQTVIFKIQKTFSTEMMRNGWPVTFSIRVLTCM